MKGSKFNLYPAKQGEEPQGRDLICVNTLYKEGAYRNGDITLQDLMEFITERGIDPAKVEIPTTFSVTVKP